MNRIAIIKNGIVDNIISGDLAFANSIPDETVILNNEIAEIGYSYDGTTFAAPIQTQEEKQIIGKIWRDSELARTDFIVPLTDFPNHAAWITYRQELRDWTTTSDFPDTKPTAPAELN